MQKKNLRGKRIMVVEDEATVRDAIGMLLGLDDHKVVQAKDGAHAIELFVKSKFDLVITDFEMPEMRGNELAKKIKAIDPRQPILMLTAYSEKVGAENPVDLVINKPFSLEDLRNAIAAVVRRQTSRLPGR